MLHQIGTGSLGPVFRGEDPDTGERIAIKHLQLKIGPERSRFIAEDLRALIGQLPAHLALTRLLDAGVEAGHPFVVSSLAAGESLDIALREYGPAVLPDALPRLERIAEALDLAAQAGIWHGALHPRDVMVSARETKITGMGLAMVLDRAGVHLDPRPPYRAPEAGTPTGALAGSPAGSSAGSPAADRYAFAAVAHEWIFGRAIDGPAETPLTVPELPGVNAERLSDAFTTALAPQPSDRFATCAAFVSALRAAARPSSKRRPAAVLPFEADEPAGAALLSTPPVSDALIETPAPLTPAVDLPLDAGEPVFPAEAEAVSVPAPAPLPVPVHPAPRIVPHATPAAVTAADPDASVRWRGSLSAAEPPSSAHGSGGFSLRVLAAVLLAGIAIGVVGGYLLANSRRMNARVPATADASAAAPATARPEQVIPDTPVPAAAPAPPPADTAPARAAASPAEPAAPARAVRRDAPSAAAPTAPAAPRKDAARLLVRTTPPGASVTVDGTVRGKSPIALRDLELGTRTIVVARPGYVSAERRITLTADRPSRSVDVSLALVTAARPAPPRPSAAAAASGLIIDSRPQGAVVTVDGVRAGTTPLTLQPVTPGSHTVLIERAGYRPWSTTVEVKAGERPRVAASLVGGSEKE